MEHEQELERIGSDLAGLDPPLVLTVHSDEGQPELGARFLEIAQTLAAASGGGVVVDQGHAGGLPAAPGMALARGALSGVRYLALPEGPETPPFAAILATLARGAADSDLAERLGGLAAPAEILVFIAAACPHCPRAVEAASRVALASPLVTLTVIDAQRFPALAERYSVTSVPASVLDGGLTWIGIEGAGEIARRILSRASAEHGAEVFRSLVEAGRHADAAKDVLAGPGATHFAALWKQSTTSTRIGLMLIAEGALEQNPQAFHGVVGELIPALAAEDAALRGDTADLLGQTKHAEALEAIRPLLDDPNPDVAEIAAEALGLDED